MTADAHRDAGDRRCRQHGDLQREERRRETAQQIEGWLLPGMKKAEWLEVKDAPRRIRYRWLLARSQERREGLAGLGVAG